ncbi:hypothetical protein VNO77_36766 [Canavalia gladiata]|uniref:Uncharacterized protein n=1 Tax=Canavalia gladiata TaxID=3824 RepID=A0AAN9PVT4_CANGL
MAGGTAAECAAVACCPCAVLNLVFLALYTVPVGLFKKAAHKRRRRLMKSNVVGNKKNDVVIFQPQRSSSVDPGPTGLEEYLETEHPAAADKSEDVALEKEMWARFAGTGFWRMNFGNCIDLRLEEHSLAYVFLCYFSLFETVIRISNFSFARKIKKEIRFWSLVMDSFAIRNLVQFYDIQFIPSNPACLRSVVDVVFIIVQMDSEFIFICLLCGR